MTLVNFIVQRNKQLDLPKLLNKVFQLTIADESTFSEIILKTVLDKNLSKARIMFGNYLFACINTCTFSTRSWQDTRCIVRPGIKSAV